MNPQILALLIALCGVDKECLSETVLLAPQTTTQAVRDFRGYSAVVECAKSNDCSEEKAKDILHCERSGGTKCQK